MLLDESALKRIAPPATGEGDPDNPGVTSFFHKPLSFIRVIHALMDHVNRGTPKVKCTKATHRASIYQTAGITRFQKVDIFLFMALGLGLGPVLAHAHKRNEIRESPSNRASSESMIGM